MVLDVYTYCQDATFQPGGGSMFHNRTFYSNADFIVIISCRPDMLWADPLSAVELSSLMNLSGVNDSGWGNVACKTVRGLA